MRKTGVNKFLTKKKKSSLTVEKLNVKKTTKKKNKKSDLSCAETSGENS